MTFTSTLTRATPTSKSLRTTIPVAFVDALKLEVHIQLEWDIYIDKKRKHFLRVRKGPFKEMQLTDEEIAKLEEIGMEIDKDGTGIYENSYTNRKVRWELIKLTDEQIEELKKMGIDPDKGIWDIKPVRKVLADEPVRLSMTHSTIISRASPKSRSLRTTIPAAFVEIMDLKPSGTLEWDLNVDNNKKYYLTVAKGSYIEILPNTNEKVIKNKLNERSIEEQLLPHKTQEADAIAKTPRKVEIDDLIDFEKLNLTKKELEEILINVIKKVKDQEED